MAIVKMQKLGICANKRKRKPILETLQKLGTVEIFTDDIEDEALSRMDTQEARVHFERNADSFDRALKLLDAYAPVKTKGLSLFAGKDPVNRSEYERVISNLAEYLDEVSLILKSDKEISECGGLIARDQNQIESLTPWMGLGIPMNTEGTKHTAALIGTLPEPCTEERLYEAASKDLPSPVCLTAEIISAGSDMTCVSVLCLRKDREKVEENLRSIGFARPSQAGSLSPAETRAELEADIETQKNRIEELRSLIISFGGRREEYRIVADYFRTRAEKYRILGTLPQSSSAFFLEGWVPADKADRVAALLGEKLSLIHI